VIRRKTNRRHMIGDHHGRTAGRATLLLRAMDEILGTHRGARAAVLGGYAPRSRTGWMWDLSVSTDHDFYIDVAATTAILVHNCAALDGRLAARVDQLHGALDSIAQDRRTTAVMSTPGGS
jgi:hypothetical protein